MKNKLVIVPTPTEPIKPSPGFAKKQLAEYKLDILGLCGFGCTYCSSNAGNYLRIRREEFADLTEKQTGARTYPSADPALTFHWAKVVANLKNQVARAPAGWGMGNPPMEWSNLPPHKARQCFDFRCRVGVSSEPTLHEGKPAPSLAFARRALLLAEVGAYADVRQKANAVDGLLGELEARWRCVRFAAPKKLRMRAPVRVERPPACRPSRFSRPAPSPPTNEGPPMSVGTPQRTLPIGPPYSRRSARRRSASAGAGEPTPPAHTAWS